MGLGRRQSSISKCCYLFITQFPFSWLCGAFTFRIWRLKVTIKATYSIPQLHKVALHYACPTDVCILSDCQRRRLLTSQLEIQTCLENREFLSITYIVLKCLDSEKSMTKQLVMIQLFSPLHSYFQSESSTLIFHI